MMLSNVVKIVRDHSLRRKLRESWEIIRGVKTMKTVSRHATHANAAPESGIVFHSLKMRGH